MSIIEEKRQILDLIEQLRKGSTQPTTSKQRESSSPEVVSHDRVARRRQELIDLRKKGEKIGQSLLEERLLVICKKLDQRISKIEDLVVKAENETETTEVSKINRGMDLAGDLDAMIPDLDIGTAAVHGSAQTVDAGIAPKRQPNREKESSHALSGLIEDGLMPDILQIISSNAKTGLFTLEDENEKVQLYFRDGELFHAATDEDTGQSAFFAAMALEKGAFYFEDVEDLPDVRTIDANTQFLILEALRQIDEQSGGS